MNCKIKNRILLILVSVLIACFSNSYAQWEWKWHHPYPQGNYLWDLWVFDDENVIVVGDNNTIIRTKDGGSTWRMINFEQNLLGFSGFGDLVFTTPDTGWMVAKHGAGSFQGQAFQTIDGGNTWNEFSDFKALGTHERDKRKLSLFFLDQMRGWCGGYDTLYQTLNGGKTWKGYYCNLDLDAEWIEFNEISFVNKNVGLALITTKENDNFFHYIIKTMNGGQTWKIKHERGWYGSSICFKDFYHIFVGGGGNNVFFYSEDAGETWENQQDSTFIGGAIRDIIFIDDTTGWALQTVSSIVYKTIDGGMTWEENYRGDIYSPFEFRSIKFSSKDVGWIVGTAGTILKTIDGGQNWKEVSQTNTPNTAMGIDFTDSHHGWVVGGFNTIMRTEDKGNTLFSQEINQTAHCSFNSVFAYDSLTAWACGQTGHILHTDDGGENW